MKTKKRLLSILLSLVMVLGLMTGMSLTAYAATDTYTALKNNATVVHFHNSDWYIIADDSTSATEGTVTLLSADERFGKSVFNSEANNSYNASAVKAYLDKVVAGTAGEGKPDFSDVADAIAPVDLTTYKFNPETKERTGGAKLYLLDTAAAKNLHNTIKSDMFEGVPQGRWWLRSPGYYYDYAAFVGGAVYAYGNEVYNEFGVRPALQLNLSSVIFSSESKTFSLKRTDPNDKVKSAETNQVCAQVPVTIQLNSNLFVRWKGNNVLVNWGTAPSADSYEVWATYCGTSSFELVTTVQGGNKATIKKLKGKSLNKKRGVKAYVVAKQGGTTLGRTLYGHSASPKHTRTNAKKVTVKKNSYSLSVGQTDKIDAKTVKSKSSKKLLHNGYLRYASSNNSVATVSSGGRITAVGAGTCEVWVYALNGKSKTVTVNVK